MYTPNLCNLGSFVSDDPPIAKPNLAKKPKGSTYGARGGGHWPRKGVWGCAALKTPFSRLSCRSQGSHFKQKSQFTTRGSQDPLLRKFGNFSLYSLNFHPNLSSQAPKFGNFPLTSPPFQRQMSVRKPHTSEIRAAHPYLKKVECPPGIRRSGTAPCLRKFLYFVS